MIFCCFTGPHKVFPGEKYLLPPSKKKGKIKRRYILDLEVFVKEPVKSFVENFRRWLLGRHEGAFFETRDCKIKGVYTECTVFTFL